MGSGKGAHTSWIVPVRQGQILYELSGLTQNLAIKALTSAGTKLPVKTSIIRLVY